MFVNRLAEEAVQPEGAQRNHQYQDNDQEQEQDPHSAPDSGGNREYQVSLGHER